jgi:four helix bundle protein
LPYERLEDKRVYVRAEALADRVWTIVAEWEWFARRTMGRQWVDAADSIGANIAEAGGRFHPADVKNFLYYACGSLRETKYWLRRACTRGLIEQNVAVELDSEIEQLSSEVNAAINFQRRRSRRPN